MQVISDGLLSKKKKILKARDWMDWWWGGGDLTDLCEQPLKMEWLIFLIIFLYYLDFFFQFPSE